jgi:hypothetical protein
VSWSYSGDPTTTSRDELRFILQDTDINLPLLQNEELDYLIGAWLPRYDSLTYVAAVSAAVIARKFAGVVNINADGVSVDVSNVSDRYTAISAQLRQEYREAQEAGNLDISNIMVGHQWDWDIDPLTFGKKMHDNPEAGQQDFGGEWPFWALDWPPDGGLATG